MALTQVNSEGIKDGEVKTADIADQNVDLTKLPHGDGSSNGKFLRSNNGADPTWESIPAGSDTTYSISCADGDNTDEEKIRLTAGGSGSGTDDIVLEAGTGLSIARDADKITFTNTVSDTNTQLTEEQVEDFVGGMVTGNTETGITVTYEDADGTLDFVVADQTPEGTAILSTGESGGTKFLREDGDGSSSWQSVPAAGATINNATVDEIVTVASTTSQLDAESTLLYDGGLSRLTMKPGDGHTDIVRIVPNDDDEKCHIVFQNAADNDEEAYFGYEHDTNQFRFKVNSSNYRGMVISSTGRIQNGTGTDPSGNGAVDQDPQGCSATEHGFTTGFGIAQNSNSTAWTDSLFGVIVDANMNGYNSTQSASLIGMNMDNGAVEPGDMCRFYRNNTLNFRIAYDGDVTNEDNSYGSISDETLKQDIVDAGSQWNDVKAVKVRKFRFKKSVQEAADLNASSDNDRTDIVAPTLLGVVAQELETAGMNGLVEQDREKLNPKTVKYSILYMKAFKALQEAMAKIEVLETKVAALEAK